MRVTATFSEGMTRLLQGRAIGDEFEIVAQARIVGADEALVDITSAGSPDVQVVQGDLEVRLLLSRASIQGEAEDSSKPREERG